MVEPFENRRKPKLLDLLWGFCEARRTEECRFSSTVSVSRTPEPRTLCGNASLGTGL